MKNLRSPTNELVAERKELAAQVAALNRRLEELDVELFARMDKALTALSGLTGFSGEVPASTSRDQPLPVLTPPAPAFHLGNGRSTDRHNRPHQILNIENNIPTPPKPPRRKEIGKLIEDNAIELMQEAGKPLKTREIYESLMSRGLSIPGNNPMNNLSAHLSRSDKIARNGMGWIPKNRSPQ